MPLDTTSTREDGARCAPCRSNTSGCRYEEQYAQDGDPRHFNYKDKNKTKGVYVLNWHMEVLPNLDHDKDDAPAPPQKKHRTNDPMSMYDEFKDELEEIHDNGIEILVVSNLDAHIKFEFSIYEIYKVTDLKNMR